MSEGLAFVGNDSIQSQHHDNRPMNKYPCHHCHHNHLLLVEPLPNDGLCVQAIRVFKDDTDLAAGAPQAACPEALTDMNQSPLVLNLDCVVKLRVE